ncbi:hypothetical protein [Oceanobacillus iheyensis HTE831]|uniref:Uncharacterized protein n=1 Tax=Oceanobacillus iheyensis (strain DSM 14371 / CIP 107618 / JCM 11309 / KCTC 3954 / HTE831) TaxID=221109 RepID=Q8CUJ0_OCEIH|nr:hypothetical protein [Oceanobacillus iheyensis HTE831]
MRSIRRLFSRPWKAQYISEAGFYSPIIWICLLIKYFCLSLFCLLFILFCENKWSILCNENLVFKLSRTSFIDCPSSPSIIIHLALPSSLINHRFDCNYHSFF